VSNRSRDWRRSQYKRLLEKRKEYYGGWLKGNPRLGMLVSTAQLCSCPGCSRNWERRNMGKVTRKEELAELKEHEQVHELE
jgi:hypothetical protein